MNICMIYLMYSDVYILLVFKRRLSIYCRLMAFCAMLFTVALNDPAWLPIQVLGMPIINHCWTWITIVMTLSKNLDMNQYFWQSPHSGQNWESYELLTGCVMEEGCQLWRYQNEPCHICPHSAELSSINTWLLVNHNYYFSSMTDGNGF